MYIFDKVSMMVRVILLVFILDSVSAMIRVVLKWIPLLRQKAHLMKWTITVRVMLAGRSILLKSKLQLTLLFVV